jgi:hypothetical protein
LSVKGAAQSLRVLPNIQQTQGDNAMQQAANAASANETAQVEAVNRLQTLAVDATELALGVDTSSFNASTAAVINREASPLIYVAIGERLVILYPPLAEDIDNG